MVQSISFDYADIVPKGWEENLRFRKKIIKEAESDELVGHELYKICARDPLFFINTFVWTYDPRKTPPVIPFITYEYQDVAIDSLINSVGKEDILVEKSRDMGASWLCLMTFFWFFLFQEFSSFLCASAKEDLVDKTEDPDCLFSKIDFIIMHLPAFLKPVINRQRLHFFNCENHSTIDGCSTTGDLARGGRRTGILLDEFASVAEGFDVLKATRDVTNCRIFNSTPKGRGNAFYAMRQRGVKVERFHWSQHPEKAAGLYESRNGEFTPLDPGYLYGDGFEPILDGKLRSPWYDLQCARSAHNMEIAQELDIDYLGSEQLFFDTDLLDKYISEFCIPPLLTGELEYDFDTLDPLTFHSSHRGRLRLWCNLTRDGRPPKEWGYTIGCDIATGTGATPSVATVTCKRTKQVVCEFASAHISPEGFAEFVVALAKFFHNAYLIWENNGPGHIFGNAVITTGYRNIYYKKNEQSLNKKGSDVPGWHSSKDTKLKLLGEYRRALQSKRLTHRSKESIDECFFYIYDNSGSVVHSGSTISTTNANFDPAASRENHGDRVISSALSWKGVIESAPKKPAKEESVSDNCFYSRRLLRKMFRRKKDDWL